MQFKAPEVMENVEGDISAQEFEAGLPKTEDWATNGTTFLHFYQGYWVPTMLIRGLFLAQKTFAALDDDVVVASCPKTGTTWLKSLTFSVVNRRRFGPHDGPLSTTHPLDLIPTLELLMQSQSPDIEANSRPRLFGTHAACNSLPDSVKGSACKIVYVSRNPMDQFVSLWHFGAKIQGDVVEPCRLEECFDSFCRGVHMCGPFWDHVLGFWKASLARPDKILFLRYEDMKKDTAVIVRRLAGFLGFPFSEEERRGLVEEIVAACSLERLKNLRVIKNGRRSYGAHNSSLFRKGEVGDSKNFLTDSMIPRLEKIMQEKYGEFNLTYELPL